MIQPGLAPGPRRVRAVRLARIPAGAPGRAGGERQVPAGRRIRGARATAVPMAQAVAVLMARALTDRRNAAPGPAAAPVLMGLVVGSIGLSLGGLTGYAINPARDLGPRIAYAVLPIRGKSSADWGYSWVPVVGPRIGGALAGALALVLPIS